MCFFAKYFEPYKDLEKQDKIRSFNIIMVSVKTAMQETNTVHPHKLTNLALNMIQKFKNQ